MHLTATQGIVSATLALTREECEHLITLLNNSTRLWKDPHGHTEGEIEVTSHSIFSALWQFGVRPNHDAVPREPVL